MYGYFIFNHNHLDLSCNNKYTTVESNQHSRISEVASHAEPYKRAQKFSTPKMAAFFLSSTDNSNSVSSLNGGQSLKMIKCQKQQNSVSSIPIKKSPTYVKVGEWHACAVNNQNYAKWSVYTLSAIRPKPGILKLQYMDNSKIIFNKSGKYAIYAKLIGKSRGAWFERNGQYIVAFPNVGPKDSIVNKTLEFKQNDVLALKNRYGNTISSEYISLTISLIE